MKGSGRQLIVGCEGDEDRKGGVEMGRKEGKKRKDKKKSKRSEI